MQGRAAQTTLLTPAAAAGASIVSPLHPSAYPPHACSFLVVTHFTEFDKAHMAVNALVLGVLIVAKIPEMHGVRIFKINKANTDTE